MNLRRITTILLATPLALAAATGASASDPGANATADRATLEELLRERPVVATGQTRRFDLDIREADWELLPGVSTRAVTFNGTVPGPTIRVTEGDTVEIAVTNSLDVATSVHWHGLHVPFAQDGVAGITQAPIEPGTTFTYRFMAPHAGTFMYHSHGDRSREQIDRGMYAPFIIDPAGGDPVAADQEAILALQGWMVGDGMSEMEGMEADPMSMEYDYFTINGKAFPATTGLTVRQGELVRLRFINPSQTIHPMHLHGTDMAVFAKDGEPLALPQRLTTVTIAQGETYDVAFIADNPGTWLLHCHDLHHASNAGVEPGGLIMTITVVAPGDVAPEATPAAEPSPAVTDDTEGMSPMPGMDH